MLDDRTNQSRSEGQPRVHDYDAGQQERQSNGGEGRVRFFDDKPGDRSAQGFGQQGFGQQAADQVQKRVGKTGNELTSFARAWTDTNSVAFGTAAHFFLSWQREAAEFFGMRLSKDLQFGRRLVDAGDPAAVVRLHSEYVREAVADYTSTVRELTARSVKEAQQKGFAVVDRAAKAADHLQASAESAVGRN